MTAARRWRSSSGWSSRNRVWAMRSTWIRPGERWKEALNRASARCEAVICLLSKRWLNSAECNVEFRYAENLHKAILVARLESVPDDNITSEWQRCDLFPNHRPTTAVDI